MSTDSQCKQLRDINRPATPAHGIALPGPKPGGNDYRPDEVQVLLWATRQVGSSLHALKVEELEQTVRSMEALIATQSAQLRVAQVLGEPGSV